MRKTSWLFLLVCFILGLSFNLLNADEKFSRSSKSHPMWSPRENKICFILTEYWKTQGRKEKLCLIDADGTNLKELPGTLGLSNDHFCWSPNGNGIAFVKKGDSPYNRGNIYIVNKNGSTLRKLTSSEDYYSQLSWSPDGKQIAFTKSSFGSGIYNQPSPPDEIWLIGSNGASRKLTDGNYPFWSPDGKKIAFILQKMEGISLVGQTLGVINVDDGTQYHFTPKEGWITKLSSRICWFPDSSKLFFIAGDYIFSIKTQNSRNRELVVYNGVNEVSSGLSMFQNGKKLAFENNFGVCVMDLNRSRPSYRDRNDGLGSLDASLDHTGAKISFRVIKNISGKRGDGDPSLSPDGKQIVFTRDGELWLINSDGSYQAQLTNE